MCLNHPWLKRFPKKRFLSAICSFFLFILLRVKETNKKEKNIKEKRMDKKKQEKWKYEEKPQKNESRTRGKKKNKIEERW